MILPPSPFFIRPKYSALSAPSMAGVYTPPASLSSSSSPIPVSNIPDLISKTTHIIHSEDQKRGGRGSEHVKVFPEYYSISLFTCGMAAVHILSSTSCSCSTSTLSLIQTIPYTKYVIPPRDKPGDPATYIRSLRTSQQDSIVPFSQQNLYTPPLPHTIIDYLPKLQ